MYILVHLKHQGRSVRYDSPIWSPGGFISRSTDEEWKRSGLVSNSKCEIRESAKKMAALRLLDSLLYFP